MMGRVFLFVPAAGLAAAIVDGDKRPRLELLRIVVPAIAKLTAK